MKSLFKIILTVIFCTAVFCPFTAMCADKDYEAQLEEYDLSSFELLDDDTKSLLEELEINNFDYTALTNLSLKSIFKHITDTAVKKADGPFKSCAVLVCFIILSSLAGSFDNGPLSNGAGNIYSTASNTVIAVFLANQIGASITLSCSAIKLCSDFTYAFFPAFCIICAASGNTMASFSVNASLLLLSQALNFISSNVFLPVTNCFMGIGICSSLRSDLNLSGVVDGLKKIITKSVSALSALFVSFLSFKTAVASRADAIGLRSVRFIINSVVPVIGSSISEGLLSIQSYSSLIKTSVGAVGIAAIASIFLPAALFLYSVWELPEIGIGKTVIYRLR